MNIYLNFLRYLIFTLLQKLETALFNLLDKNKDGKLDEKEIKNSIKQIQKFLSQYKK